jgi:hypothetical protein
MKQLRVIVPILLLLGLGMASMLAAAELTASQSLDRSVASVGEPVNVIVVLSDNGGDISQVTVTPGYSPGIAVDKPEMQSIELYPGVPSTLSYPIRPEQSGDYLTSSLISYVDGGIERQLNMVSKLTVADNQSPVDGSSANSYLNQEPASSAVPSQEQAPGIQGEQAPGSSEHMPGSTQDTFLPGPKGFGPGSVPERNPSGPEQIQL